MSTIQKINDVIEYIGKHLDRELTLEQLSEVAHLSKYHFHRAFTALTGLSLAQMIKWLRLKRAAHQLIIFKDRSILTIAVDAGFESHEAFSRAFKKASDMSPSQFRQQGRWRTWEKPPYKLPIVSDVTMNVEIKQKPKRRLAVLEHRGCPSLLAGSVNKLMDWAQAQTVDIKPKPGESFGFAYDDPDLTKPEDWRFDLALTVPEQLKLEGEVSERYLPEGRYAIAMHKGSRDTIGETIYAMYRDWLPATSEILGDLPCVFCYYNFDHEVAETELLTEIWLLLK